VAQGESVMGCCGGGTRKLVPRREPNVNCGGTFKVFKADAWLAVGRLGVDPCSVAGTGRDGLVLRQDVERAAN
jgi:hypothetical protein